MKGLRSICALPQESLRGISPGTIGRKVPKFEWVDPRTLYVEEAYQRDLSGNSGNLIRRIIAGFSWARFKPPVCVRIAESGNVLVVIDGQHSAIAAASHPAITKIPIMIVDAVDLPARASAFVGHNRDRLGLTQMAVFYAELAGDDPIAVMIDRACQAAGAKIMQQSVNLRRPTAPGMTIAVGTIRALARKQGEEALTRVLRVLVKAGRGPIKADEIAAVALVLAAGDGHKAVDERLTALVASKTTEQWAAVASAIAAESGRRMPAELGAAWCRGLGIQAEASDVKGRIGKGGHAVEMIQNNDTLRPKAPPKPKEPTTPAQPAVPMPPKAAPQPDVAIDGETAPTRIVERNGVRLDLAARTVRHRGKTAWIDDDSIRLVAALARVMPAILDGGRLASKVFGTTADAPIRLKALVERLNPVLGVVKLQTRPVSKMGYMLADLGE